MEKVHETSFSFDPPKLQDKLYFEKSTWGKGGLWPSYRWCSILRWLASCARRFCDNPHCMFMCAGFYYRSDTATLSVSFSKSSNTTTTLTRQPVSRQKVTSTKLQNLFPGESLRAGSMLRFNAAILSKPRLWKWEELQQLMPALQVPSRRQN